MIHDVKDQDYDTAESRSAATNMAAKSRDALTLPVYRETESRADSLGSEVGSVTPTSTYASSQTPESYDAHARAHTNPFFSPLDQHPPPPQPLPPVQPTEKDAPPPTQVAGQGDGEGKKKKKKRKSRMHPFLKGVVIIAVSPVLMTGALIFGTGAFVYGAGQLLVGMGDIMMGGPLRKKAQKAWKNRGTKKEESELDMDDMV